MGRHFTCAHLLAGTRRGEGRAALGYAFSALAGGYQVCCSLCWHGLPQARCRASPRAVARKGSLVITRYSRRLCHGAVLR